MWFREGGWERKRKKGGRSELDECVVGKRKEGWMMDEWMDGSMEARQKNKVDDGRPFVPAGQEWKRTLLGSRPNDYSLDWFPSVYI